MLLISKPHTQDGAERFGLEGELTGPWVDELRSVVGVAINNGWSVILDLTAVTLADRRGVALLAELQMQQVTLSGCSPLLREQLRQADSPENSAS